MPLWRSSSRVCFNDKDNDRDKGGLWHSKNAPANVSLAACCRVRQSLSPISVDPLAAAIPGFHASLTHLDLGSNNIGDRGLAKLCEVSNSFPMSMLHGVEGLH